MARFTCTFHVLGWWGESVPVCTEQPINFLSFLNIMLRKYVKSLTEFAEDVATV